MKAKRRTGFTLIELLVTIVILSLALVSVSTLFIAGTITTSKAKRISSATNRAQQEIERLRSAGFAGCTIDIEVFPSGEGYTILEQNADLTGRVGFTPSDLPNAQGVIEIRYYVSPYGAYPNLKTITATITWGGGRPTRGQVQLRTFVANHP